MDNFSGQPPIGIGGGASQSKKRLDSVTYRLDKRRFPSYNGRVQNGSFILIFLCGLLAAPAFAQPSAKVHDMLVNADSMFRDTEKEMAELEGNIQIVFRGQHIKSDKARISLRARQVELIGNVEIMDAKNTIVGDRVYLDYESNTGIIYNGYVQSGSVMFSGSVIQKIGDADYVVSSADYTACTNCPSTWSFSGQNIRAELGGYAYIKNGWLQIASIPIFWFPYLVVPLKSDRQSGLLTPNFEVTSSGGYAIGQPYFWAISPSSDATIETKFYEKRGVKGLFEYRYVLDKNSDGKLNLASIHDNAFAEDPRLNAYRLSDEKSHSIDRWFARYQHYQQMPDGGVNRADINLASDLQYAKDFPFETLNLGDSAMENRVSYTKNGDISHTSIDSSYYVNMLHGDPLSGNEDAVHRLPELRYAQTLQNIGRSNWLYSLDLTYTNFARSGNAYDDMSIQNNANGTITKYPTNTCNLPNWEDYQDSNGNKLDCKRVYDGNYDRNRDLIRTGQRLDFQPSLYYPIRIMDGLGIVPRLAYRETHYNFDIQDQPYVARRYVRTEITSRAQVSRLYGDTLDPKGTLYKHEILPEVTYTHLPWSMQDDHPFFGTGSISEAPFSSRDSISDLDISSDYGIQFDYNDRVYDRNLMTFALTNKVTRKRWINQTPQYQQIGYLRLAQSYDASQNGSRSAEPWSDISATLDIQLDYFQTYSNFNYFPYQNVSNTSSRIRLIDSGGQFVQVAVTRQYKIIPGEPVNTSTRQEDYTISAGFISKYINFMGKRVYDANFSESGGNLIKSQAIIAQIKPAGDCALFTLLLENIPGDRKKQEDFRYAFNFEFNFDGVPKPPLPPAALDGYGF